MLSHPFWNYFIFLVLVFQKPLESSSHFTLQSIPFFMMVLLVTINYEHRDPAVFKPPIPFLLSYSYRM